MGEGIERPIKTKVQIEEEIKRLQDLVDADHPHSFGVMTDSDRSEAIAARKALEWVVR